MAKKKISNKERTSFAFGKTVSAGKWILLSGTATFFLTGFTEVLVEFELPRWAFLLVYLVINTTLFAIAKFVEGHE